MDEVLTQLWEDLLTELRRHAEELGHELGEAVDDAAAYAAERTKHLSLVVGEPGFQEALIVERDNVILYAGIRAVEEGDALDQRMKESFTVTLNVAANLIALIV